MYASALALNTAPPDESLHSSRGFNRDVIVDVAVVLADDVADDEADNVAEVVAEVVADNDAEVEAVELAVDEAEEEALEVAEVVILDVIVEVGVLDADVRTQASLNAYSPSWYDRTIPFKESAAAAQSSASELACSSTYSPTLEVQVKSLGGLVRLSMLATDQPSIILSTASAAATHLLVRKVESSSESKSTTLKSLEVNGAQESSLS
jgi:hypothetical protein